MAYTKSNPDSVDQRNKWFLFFLFLCIIIGCIIGAEKLAFGVSGENLTSRVRKLLFRGIIYKQVSWFDDEQKAPGVLTTVLSEDVASLNGMTTETLSTVIEACLGLVLGVLLAAYFCWPMSLITIGTIPIMIVGVIAMAKLQWKKTTYGVDKGDKDPYLKSNALLSDVILNFRTVISFGEKNINSLISKYEKLLREPANRRIRSSHIAGFFFGYSQAARMVWVGIVFFLGTIMIRKLEYKGDEAFISIWILFSCAMGAGSSMSNVPSVTKAKESAVKIFNITDEKSTLDVRNATESQIKQVKEGKIVFKDVDFKYPSRTTPIFDKFNMEIPATFKIALVGHSGCGKSTITNLLLRFYHTQAG
jgi:ATP-binding cassette, subfamily B (MDR/TAP), member 1